MANDQNTSTAATELYLCAAKRAREMAKATGFVEDAVVEYLATLIIAEGYRRGIGAQLTDSMEFCKYISALPSDVLGLYVLRVETNGLN